MLATVVHHSDDRDAAGGRRRRSWYGRLRQAAAQWPAPVQSGDVLALRRYVDGSVMMLLADVCGNGIAAAGIAGRLRSMLTGLLDRHRRPSALLGALNRQIGEIVPDDCFVSAVAARIDRGSRRLHVARAGHVGPFVKRGRVPTLAVAWPSGPALGLVGDQTYDEDALALEVGDTVVLVTDGISDPLATPGDPLGESRLRLVLDGGPASPALVCERLGSAAAAPAHETVRDSSVLAVQLAA